MENENRSIDCNLELISFFSCQNNFDAFLHYLAKEVVKKNRLIQEKSEEKNRFEIAIYNEKDETVLVEYIFFVKVLIDFIKLERKISKQDEEKIYGFLYFSKAKFHLDFRFIFIVGILGSMFGMSYGYFSMIGRKFKNVYANRVVRNDFGNYAVARHIPFSAVLLKEVDLELYEKLIDMNYLEVEAFGSTSVTAFLKKNKIETKFVFDVEKPKNYVETGGSFN